MVGSGGAIRIGHHQPVIFGCFDAQGQSQFLVTDVARRVGDEAVVEVGTLALELVQVIHRAVIRPVRDDDDLKGGVVLGEKGGQVPFQFLASLAGIKDDGEGRTIRLEGDVALFHGFPTAGDAEVQAGVIDNLNEEKTSCHTEQESLVVVDGECFFHISLLKRQAQRY